MHAPHRTSYQPHCRTPHCFLASATTGDIVVPGIFIALVLRMDVARAAAAPQGAPPKARYFRSAMVGYVSGLGTTIAVMNIFNAAQPALLYIVPAVLGAVAARAAVAGELAAVAAWEEGSGEEGDEGEGEGAAEGDASASEGSPDAGWVKLPKAEATKVA
jgi:minor histocompatibility antigen H13